MENPHLSQDLLHLSLIIPHSPNWESVKEIHWIKLQWIISLQVNNKRKDHPDLHPQVGVKIVNLQSKSTILWLINPKVLKSNKNLILQGRNQNLKQRSKICHWQEKIDLNRDFHCHLKSFQISLQYRITDFLSCLIVKRRKVQCKRGIYLNRQEIRAQLKGNHIPREIIQLTMKLPKTLLLSLF